MGFWIGYALGFITPLIGMGLVVFLVRLADEDGETVHPDPVSLQPRARPAERS